jgi:hypothetical protein
VGGAAGSLQGGKPAGDGKKGSSGSARSPAASRKGSTKRGTSSVRCAFHPLLAFDMRQQCARATSNGCWCTVQQVQHPLLHRLLHRSPGASTRPLYGI